MKRSLYTHPIIICGVLNRNDIDIQIIQQQQKTALIYKLILICK